MKRGATKEEIIRTTQDLITRNGIRAVRVDEIAQRLGISKRTLYEMFADKNDLISACLDDLARRQRQRIAASRRRRSGNPLQRTLRLANDYIDSLYTVDHSFLADIRRKVLFAEQYDEHREFWRKELSLNLEECRGGGVAPVGDRHRRSGRATDEHAVRAAAEPHNARRALPPLPDDSPGRCDAAGNRPHRPETVIRIPADRKSRRRILRLFFMPGSEKKRPTERSVPKFFYICTAKRREKRNDDDAYGIRRRARRIPPSHDVRYDAHAQRFSPGIVLRA